LKNGVIYEYEGPVGIKFDISTSYLIETQLPVRIFRFRSMKSRLRVRDVPFVKGENLFFLSMKKNLNENEKKKKKGKEN
jgi:hypothetical protein